MFKETMAEISLLLNNDMQEVNKIIIAKMDSEVSLIPTIANYIINSGGKRIRPILTLLGAKIFDYNHPLNAHILLSACIEFIHTATLLHDDIVDENYTRRGKETSNALWGNQACVLVGDYLFSKAFELMVQGENLEILAMLSKSSSTIAKGEIMQLSNLNNINLSMDDYIETIFAKTASLFSASTKVGAILTNQNHENRNNMENYGINLGITFQIFDDILDYSANAKELGKDIGTDMKEGKITLPILLSLQQCGSKEKSFLEEVFKDLKQDDKTLGNILEIFKKYDILNQSYLIAQSYLNKAIENLDGLPNNIYKDKLIKLAQNSIHRKF
jgi:octaprenyl-diphosphate synthase